MNSGSSLNVSVMPVMMLLIMIPVLAIVIFKIWLYCRVFSKTGYHWALGLLLVVPFGDIIVLLILAFGDWPVLDELRRYRQQDYSRDSSPPPIPCNA